MKQSTRRTKVIWSFESDYLNDALVDSVIAEDADAIRLVYKVGAAPKIASFLKSLTKKNTDDCPKSIMIDVSTKIRGHICNVQQPLELEFGKRVRLTPVGGKGDLEVKTDEWSTLFAEDAIIYLGYGNVLLRAKKVTTDAVDADVVQGGTVYPDLGIHVPTTQTSAHFAEIPREDLQTLLKAGIDFLVIPGGVAASEIQDLRKVIQQETKNPPWIILKVNSEKVYDKLDELLPAVDGVLISRLEMALGIDAATIPIRTKEIIQMCNDRSKIVFTASEMLGSMRHNATPTRAEVSDIANSVIDGSDAVVLSEEVAYGKYSLRALHLMRQIIQDIEAHAEGQPPNWIRLSPSIENEMDAIAYTAYKTAERIKAKALVCITVAGNTAVRLATFRTLMPIIAVTFDPVTLRRLNLVRGVTGLSLDADPHIDQVLPVVNDRLVRGNYLNAGDRIVFVSITLSSVGREGSNLFTVQTLV